MTSSPVIHRADAKELGAYYTSEEVAAFLVSWAIRLPSDEVLDPSFGDGVFIESAIERVAELGGVAREQVHGVELNADAFDRVARSVCCAGQLRSGDFFDFSARDGQFPRFDVVVGNPPFIRYQRFTGNARKKALRRAEEEGVVLSQLTSSWAPFVIHSASMLRRGGRLAMVIPYEVAYARYAKPVLQYLAANFSGVSLLTFEEPLFPHLNEATVLLLADGKEMGPAPKIVVRQLSDASALNPDLAKIDCRIVDIEARTLVDDEERFATLHLPREYRDLYAAAREFCVPVGAVADVGIGYVTGANDFFHVSPETVQRYGLPARVLVPTVCRGSAFNGAFLTKKDWKNGLASGVTAYLLKLDEGEPPAEVEKYLRIGRKLGVPQRYKCRMRSPWYRVPNVYRADALMTYMSGQRPRLVANDAGAFAPNTLHVVRLKNNAPARRVLSLLWQTSIARLSAQIEGHGMGGGMLKLEPREAERVLLPDVTGSASLNDASVEADRLIRAGREDEARRLADDATLEQHGFTAADCDRLAHAAELLIQRRCRIPKNAADQRLQSRRPVGQRNRSGS